MKLSKALNWDEIAYWHNKETGSTTRIRPMDAIFEWAASQTDMFKVDDKEGTIHRIIKGGDNESVKED